MTQASGEPMSRNDYLSKVNVTFDSIESLWTETDSVENVQGLETDEVTQAKTQIEQAYQSMKEARRILSH